MPTMAVEALSLHRDRQRFDERWAGSRWHSTGYVFTSTIGTPVTGGDLTKRFQARLAAAGLPRMRWHDLRHATATLMLAAGEHPKVVQGAARSFDDGGDDGGVLARHPIAQARCRRPDGRNAGGSTHGILSPRGCTRGCRAVKPNARPIPSHGAGRAIPCSVWVVPEVRLELTRACAHRCLRPTRLPIPPLRRGEPSL